jgi:tetratricopeptide (TPR) repeat protein
MAALSLLSRCAEVCAALGDAERAALLYERLLPHGDRWLVFAGGLCTGTVRVRLGVLAMTRGDHEQAVRHLESAVAAHREAGAVPITALAEVELADALRVVGHHERANALVGHALRMAQALGMLPLIERVESVPQPAEAQPRGDARLALEDEGWLVEFGGRRARVRNRKGIAYLARLLERPHLEIPALELAGGQAETPQGDAGPMLDEEAKRAYRRRVDELREEIDQARRWNDPERAERASAELDLLGAELSRAVGLGGRDRRAASNAERARVSVTRAIRSAIEAIEDHHEELGSHLAASVRTGTHCRYAPAAGDEVAWRIERSSQAS